MMFIEMLEQPEKMGEYEVRFFCHRLSQRFKDVRFRTIGRSECSRGITALEFGCGRDPVLFVGGTHGMEWASVLVCLRLCYEIALSQTLERPLFGIDFSRELLRRGLTIVPLLNPDGFELQRRGPSSLPQACRKRFERFSAIDFSRWQANAKGVDLNHNFAAGFYTAYKQVRALGVTRPGPTRYGGLFPFSQSEARALRKLCAMSRFRALYSLHSQGEEIYWRYGERIPERSMYIAGVLRDLSGYALGQPELAASHAGLKDWFIKRYGRPGYTIELGLGENPLPYGDFPAIWERVRRALCVAVIL